MRMPQDSQPPAGKLRARSSRRGLGPAATRPVHIVDRGSPLAMNAGEEDGDGNDPTSDLFQQILDRLGADDLPRSTRGPGLALSSDGLPSSHPKASLWARLAGRSLDPARFEVRGLLGRGGMGEVREVRDVDLERTLAMKVLPGERLGADGSRQRHRFLEEAQVTGQLDHPGIVPIHELGVDPDGCPFFTMRRVQGKDLSEILSDPSAEADWSTPRALQVLQRVAETVAFAHSKGIVHRDLKPANIMLGPYGEVYVMDWGLAKQVGVDQPGGGPASQVPGEVDSPTLAGDILGTPSYMSPEQAGLLDGELGPLSDVYSLGAMLYELLTGHAPYQDTPRNSRQVLAGLAMGPPLPLEELAPGVAAELAAICNKAMAREPKDRYPGAVELAADIRALLEGRVVTAHRTGALVELQKWVLRNRWISAISFALMLALVVGFATISTFYIELRDKQFQLELSPVDLHRVNFLELLDSEPELWPVHPDMAPRMAQWIEDAETLQREVPKLLERLSQKAPGDTRLDRLRALNESLAILDRPGDGLLTAQSAGGRIGMRARLALANASLELSMKSAEARAAWPAAIQAISASAVYGGLEIPPQVGLFPLGPDPQSKLWEFALVSTGNIPARHPRTNQLVLDEDSAIVFVLLPGGETAIGTSDDPDSVHFDPYMLTSAGRGRIGNESPVYRAILPAFFLGKHELTQAQYLRMTGSNPSFYPIGHPLNSEGRTAQESSSVTGMHPVENINWFDAKRCMGRFAISLPPEPHAEYGCRAGTTTSWNLGADDAALVGVANLQDSSDQGEEAELLGYAHVDPWELHTPVTVGPVNGFGLINAIGNVQEWCRDPYRSYESFPSEVDLTETGGPLDSGVLESPDPAELELANLIRAVFRGGSFRNGPDRARSGYRGLIDPNYQDDHIGIRPMRPLQNSLSD